MFRIKCLHPHPLPNIKYQLLFGFLIKKNAISMISDREVRVCVLVATQQARERDAVQVWRAAAGGRRPTGRGRWRTHRLPQPRPAGRPQRRRAAQVDADRLAQRAAADVRQGADGRHVAQHRPHHSADLVWRARVHQGGQHCVQLVLQVARTQARVPQKVQIRPQPGQPGQDDHDAESDRSVNQIILNEETYFRCVIIFNNFIVVV
jgi:hypothetical protein